MDGCSATLNLDDAEPPRRPAWPSTAVNGSATRSRNRHRAYGWCVSPPNSPRRLSVALDVAPLVRYLAAAGKPVRVAPYRDLPRPGVAIGDQLATDGMLAWRLGFAFLHLRLPLDPVPLGPQLMNHLGRPLRRLLFRPRT